MRQESHGLPQAEPDLWGSPHRNGGTDGSQAVADQLGACVVPVPKRGYGAALLGAIAAARGKYTIMGDADDSYDFSKLEAFVEKLRDGYDLVMGNRFRGGIEPGAMPALHRYFGNPVLSMLGRVFFKIPVGDFHCGLRGFRTASMRRLGLISAGMEFASEMVVRSSLERFKIAEVLRPFVPTGADGRRISKRGAMGGAISSSCSCTARSGCSSSRGLC